MKSIGTERNAKPSSLVDSQSESLVLRGLYQRKSIGRHSDLFAVHFIDAGHEGEHHRFYGNGKRIVSRRIAR